MITSARWPKYQKIENKNENIQLKVVTRKKSVPHEHFAMEFSISHRYGHICDNILMK